MVTRKLLLIALSEAVLILMGIYGYSALSTTGQPISSASSDPVTLTGVGATLAYPLLSSIYDKYEGTHPNVRISYTPIGSEAGISQFLFQTVDFAATYPPMNQKQVKSALPEIPLHIPESISGVVVAYNLPGFQGALQLDGNTIANIFLDRIQYWDDPQITGSNTGLTFPHAQIQTIHMAEAEGTTFVFTSYLSSISPDFRQSLGFGTSVPWTTGVSVPTDAGVAGLMATTPNSIGYMELSYALQTKLAYASIRNSAGNYIVPSEASARAAENAFSSALPKGDGDWSNINLLNEPGNDAYPLVTFTYILVYQNLSGQKSMDLAKATALVDFLWYLIHDGQTLGPPLGYVPLPANVVSINEASLKSITFQGKPLLSTA
jgi:phosphate transport system substrate-binding protein